MLGGAVADMPKDLARKMGLFCLVDPSQLTDLDELAEWLLSLGSGLCTVVERDGELLLLEARQRVAVIDRGMRIEIHPHEHAPPHFHVGSETMNASFAIDDCSLLRGNVTSSEQRRIRYWHRRAKPMLIDFWNSTRPGDCAVGEYRHH
jgi:hypothetical protein